MPEAQSANPLPKPSTKNKTLKVTQGVFGLLALLGLFLLSRANYLLFHQIIEVYAICVGAAVFITSWNVTFSARIGFLSFLGIVYLQVSILDALHAFSYKGLNIFTDVSGNLATQFWVAGRLVEALGFLLSFSYLHKPLPRERALLYSSLLTGALIAIILSGLFPACYIEGQGLTPFKVASEYAVMLLLALAAVLFWRKRGAINKLSLRYLLASIVTTIVAESFFTLYVDVYGTLNFLGHVCKVVSYYFLYKSLIQASVLEPISFYKSELHASDARLSSVLTKTDAILDATPNMVFSFAPDDRLLTANRAVATHDRRIDLQGTPLREVFASLRPPFDADQIRRELLRRPRTVWKAELPGEEGPAIWEFTAFALPSEQGAEVVGCVAVDVTARERLEQTLLTEKQNLERAVDERTASLRQAVQDLQTRETELMAARERVVARETLYRQTFEHANVGIAHVGLDGSWLRVNPRLEALLGYTAEELLSLTHRDLTHPDDLDTDLERSRELITGTEEHYCMEKRFITKNKSTLWFLLSVAMRRDTNGAALHFIFILQDITQKKLLEEERDESLRALQRKNAALEEFAHVVSHDMREPLRGIYNYANLLLDDYARNMSKEGKAILSKITSLSERQERQIQAIQQWAKADKEDIRCGPCDLGEIIRDVLASIELEIQRKGIAIHVYDAFPTVSCDRGWTHVLFYNLIHNAEKFNDKLHKEITIGYMSAAKLHAAGEKLPDTVYPTVDIVYFVQDNGIGIASQDNNEIFKMFKRLTPDSRFGPGSGAGLAIVRKIVERHDGTIWVDSTPGEGSTFFFTLGGQEGEHIEHES